MVGLCAFCVLLILGYFLIDKKTQGELVNKCKKNKFIILGGLFFFYFFFFQNNFEGMGNYNPEIYTSFINNICYGRGGMTSESLYLLNQRLVADGHSKISDTNPSQCLMDGMSHKSQIEPHLSQRGGVGGPLYVTP